MPANSIGHLLGTGTVSFFIEMKPVFTEEFLQMFSLEASQIIDLHPFAGHQRSG